MYMPETGSITECPLPDESTGWSKVVVVPDKASEPLRILVSPGHDPSNQLGDMLQMMSINLPNGENRQESQERVKIWELKNPNSWHEIETRGCNPDRFVISRTGSACAKVRDKLIVFGGCDIVDSRGGRNDHSSANAFLLDLKVLEWFRVPHPYSLSIDIAPLATDARLDSARRPRKTLPVFQGVWNINVDGCEMITMLRKGKAEVNHKRENELVPKFALDLLEITSNDSALTKPEVSWILDVPTVDQCGYIAPMFASCIQIGSTSLILGSIARYHTNFLDSTPQVFDILTFDNTKIQWRGINIHNLELLTPPNSDFNDSCHFVHGSDSEHCYCISPSSDVLRICEISNLHSVGNSLTKPLNSRQRSKALSKKNTLSYQLNKAKRDKFRPRRECTSCGAFERPGINFKCCSRCRMQYYCTKSCQKRHWKAGHKHQCVPAPIEKRSKSVG